MHASLFVCPCYSCDGCGFIRQDEPQFVLPRHIEVPIYAYPQIARAAHVSEGEVAVKVTIDCRWEGRRKPKSSAELRCCDKRRPTTSRNGRFRKPPHAPFHADDDLRLQTGRD